MWTAQPHNLSQWNEKSVGRHGCIVSAIASDMEEVSIISVANEVHMEVFSTSSQGTADPDRRRAQGSKIDLSQQKEEYFRIWDGPNSSTAVFTRDIPASLAFIPGSSMGSYGVSRCVAVGTVSAVVRVFQLSDIQTSGGKADEYLPGRGVRGAMHRNYIKSLASNDEYLASASADSTVKIWKINRQKVRTST